MAKIEEELSIYKKALRWIATDIAQYHKIKAKSRRSSNRGALVIIAVLFVITIVARLMTYSLRAERLGHDLWDVIIQDIGYWEYFWAIFAFLIPAGLFINEIVVYRKKQKVRKMD